MDTDSKPELKRIAFIGNYLPRQCGIATFTTDVSEAVAAEYPEATCFTVAMNDIPEGYAYPERVAFEIAEGDVAAYRRAADFLNVNNVDLVCVQHEFGIYGGPAGSHLLALLCDLRMPIVTTLHTVLPKPDTHQRKVMTELASLSDRLIVMSERSVRYMQEIYGVPREKIDFIPHGIPDVPFVDSNFYKDHFGVEGKTVLLTFGLLSENKGIEHVIKALPLIRERYPNVVYMVLGATHPNVLRHDGESYRLSLQRLARKLRVADSVIFYNRFVTLPELVEFIGAADIYITPYLNPEQVVSGTLAYTVGAGKAVISTPYWYAEELLADGRGLLVPFGDPEAIGQRVLDLLDNETERHAMRKRAYMFGRDMVWPQVARQYMASFESARAGRLHLPRLAEAFKSLGERPGDLPPLKLDHLRLMTDDTGMLQHAVYAVPNYQEGYTTDDNARALVAAVCLEELGMRQTAEAQQLASRYLAFLWNAFNPATSRFRNFMAYDRQWLEEIGSEDSHARALWALGTVLGRSQSHGWKGMAARLFHQAIVAAWDFQYPRAWAFTLIGIHEYLRHFLGDRSAQRLRDELAERLLASYHANSAPGWPWFEDILTYTNARLPQALLLSGRDMGRSDMLDAALTSLRWLTTEQRCANGHFVPIGNQGWYPRGGERARFDQQPVEAYVSVAAALDAYRLTGDRQWYEEATCAFEWFLGRNDLGLPLYDPATGGCCDGLHSDRVNQNQGAESTLAFLLSSLELRLAESLLPETHFMPPSQAPASYAMVPGSNGKGAGAGPRWW
jgi:glycosyltransferase involved in cell wall biosynthesis